MHDAGAPDRLLEGGADGGVEAGHRLRDGLGGHAQLSRAHAVEALGPVQDRVGAPRLDVADDGKDRGGRLLHVDGGPGQDGARVRIGAAQVDPLDHAHDCRSSLLT